MSDRKNPQYEVGYRRPPSNRRFKPGESGNPKGRPKYAKNFATVLQNELHTRVPVTENGKRKKISKREAIGKQLVNKAASGDLKAVQTVMNEARAYENSAMASRNSVSFENPEDQLVMANIIKRIRQMDDPETSVSLPAHDNDILVEIATESDTRSDP